MNRILVTGVNGFVGKHLVRELKSRGCTVVGLGYKEPVHPTIENLLADYLNCDLNDAQAVTKLPLTDIVSVINLAGLAQVGDSFKQPELYNQVNIGILDNLGKVLLNKNNQARLIAVSTGAVYDSRQPLPLTEDSKVISSGSPYALSKLAMEKTAKDLSAAGLDCVVARPFNHIGPSQGPGFLLPDLYAQLMNSSLSGQVVKVGNLLTKRDYTDVRDVARAYADLVLANKLTFSVYNICSGTSRSGQDILNALLTATNLKEKVSIQKDSSLLRPNDPPDLYGSADRLYEDCSWQPRISIEQTIKDFVAASNR